MLREYTQLVSETVDDGFERGIALFMENLEIDMIKSDIINEASGDIDKVLALQFEQYFEEQEGRDGDEDVDDEVDTLLNNLKKEGLID